MTKYRGISINELFLLAIIKTLKERNMPAHFEQKILQLLEQRYTSAGKVFRTIFDITNKIDKTSLNIYGTRNQRLKVRRQIRVKILEIWKLANVLKRIKSLEL